MFHVIIPASEQWDEAKQEFVYVKEQKLQLEHSLVSLSKWESKWCKPFLSKEDKSIEETLDYIRCMTITQNVDPNVYNYIPDSVIKDILDYIDSPMTATRFSGKEKGGNNGEQVTAEIIYYWMIALNIPSEYQKWHLNKLLTLIRVCSIKNHQPKKMTNRQILSNNTALNASRRKMFNTKG